MIMEFEVPDLALASFRRSSESFALPILLDYASLLPTHEFMNISQSLVDWGHVMRGHVFDLYSEERLSWCGLWT